MSEFPQHLWRKMIEKTSNWQTYVFDGGKDQHMHHQISCLLSHILEPLEDRPETMTNALKNVSPLIAIQLHLQLQSAVTLHPRMSLTLLLKLIILQVTMNL